LYFTFRDIIHPEAADKRLHLYISMVNRANRVMILWLFVIFGEQGIGLLPAALGIVSNWTRWRLLRHLRPLYPAPAAWWLSQLAPRITKSDDDPILFTSVRI